MAKNIIFIIEEDDVFVDESGKTSLEPEGAGHHHDWNASPDGKTDPQVESLANMDMDFDSGEGYPRGPRPVEGDGTGAPE